MLYEIEVCGDASFHEVPPPYLVLAAGKCSHSRRHCSKRDKCLIAPHQNVLGDLVGEFKVSKAVLGEPFAEIICCVGQ